MTSFGEDEKTPVVERMIVRNPMHEGLVRALTNNIAVLDSLRVTMVIHREEARDRVDPMPPFKAGEIAKSFRAAQDSAGQVAQQYEKIRDGGG